MKPHIRKRDGLWLCGYPTMEGYIGIGYDELSAYADWKANR